MPGNGFEILELKVVTVREFPIDLGNQLWIIQKLHSPSDEIHAITNVDADPPRLSFRTMVSFESRYEMRGRLPLMSSMTRPWVTRSWLINPASATRSLSLEWCSDPAKSARTNRPLVVLQCKSRSEWCICWNHWHNNIVRLDNNSQMKLLLFVLNYYQEMRRKKAWN